MSTDTCPPLCGEMKLFLTAAFFWVIVATTCVSATNGPVLSCCLTISDTKVHPKNIVNYTVQRMGPCPVEAVVFQTCRRKTVCSDPGKDWVKRVKGKVDKEKEKRKRQPSCRKQRRRQRVRPKRVG
ncbi:hypothetical protein COCON_G00090050 [Conger conger]|uniref:Chemokine interleukin-8-like domain-containing protein n=1 Tax=Conger conger TaxID=82655 RepID=A0A9Q1DKU0_CONCO|nr:monocyte chemotactic protein 1B-like [Conger conger]KAJ8274380.1 hypothetical protein COCON_G00090050 [Conger conger]